MPHGRAQGLQKTHAKKAGKRSKNQEKSWDYCETMFLFFGIIGNVFDFFLICGIKIHGFEMKSMWWLLLCRSLQGCIRKD